MKRVNKALLLLLVVPVYMQGKSLMKTGFSSSAHKDYMNAGVKAVIKDIDYHKGGMGERISFRFIGQPLCHYIPNSEQNLEQAVAAGTEITLQFLLPSVEIKGDKNKQLINQINATKYPTHALTIEPITKPMAGYLVTVTFHPKHRGFQLESSVSLKGEPTLWLTFYQLDLLQKINYSVDSIRKTADSGQVVEKKKYV